MTALLYAAEKGRVDVVRVLLDAGADVRLHDQVSHVMNMLAIDV